MNYLRFNQCSDQGGGDPTGQGGGEVPEWVGYVTQEAGCGPGGQPSGARQLLKKNQLVFAMCHGSVAS